MIKKYLFLIIIIIIVIFLFFFIVDVSTKKSCNCFVIVSQTNFLTQEMANSAYQQCLDNTNIKIDPDCCINKNKIEKSFCIFKSFF